MAHTNMNIPDPFDGHTQAREENELLKFKISMLEKKTAWLYDQLANIHEAIEKYGYVDFKFGREKGITLVKKPEDSK